jgi:tetratricopeptide (TPR) repeat protein
LLATAYTANDDPDRARTALEDAVRSDPDLGEPRYALAENYLRGGKSDSALALLESSLRHGYVGAPETYLAIGKRLEFSGRSAAAARLYSSYLEAKYTKAVWDRPGTSTEQSRQRTSPSPRTYRCFTSGRRRASSRSRQQQRSPHSIRRERDSLSDLYRM